MNVIETALPGVWVIEPKIFGDERGFFVEQFNVARYQKLAGLKLAFVQDNMSRSTQGVLRGLHYQLHHTQGKLVWITQGKAWDVIVDVRYGSPTFGQYVGIALDAATQKQVYVPPGFAHGFCALSPVVDFHYKCTDYYDPNSEMTIAWDDPILDIQWPLTDPIVSDKDKQHAHHLQDLPPHQLPQYAAWPDPS